MFTSQANLDWKTKKKIIGPLASLKKGKLHSETIKNKETLKILIVDDSQINQMIVEKSVHKLGFRADIANNGEQAIEMLRKSSYDLILMDVQMPIMDGIETTQYIRKELDNQNSNIKIIAMTSTVVQTEIERYYEVGINSCLEKPFNAIELFDKILEQLDAKSGCN